MNYQEIADLMFPDINEEPEVYEKKYPCRSLKEGAIVSRIGPSPTGFVHLGNLFNAIICERLVRNTDGVFILRIEDTDKKREVEGAVEILIDYMDYYGIKFDEGATKMGDNGNYGPYRQRERKKIYQAYAKDLVKRGLAYPCFCTEEKLSEIRNNQLREKLNVGYYGKWASDRELPVEKAKALIKEGVPFVTRFKSPGNEHGTIYFEDGIKGNLELQENFLDFVLLKSDGIPTYHFAHVIDDHLMRTTHVIRGEEWLSSVPIHLQLFNYLGFTPPRYYHTAQLMKIDGTSKRKLSKRKDPELALSFYKKKGYLPEVIWHYFLTIINSNYEEWLRNNSDKTYTDFKLCIEKMSKSGILFDLAKLDNISKNIIAKKSDEFIFNELIKWANEFDEVFHRVLLEDVEYTISVIGLGRNQKNPRKDYANWSEAREFLLCFFDGTFKVKDFYSEKIDRETFILIINEYLRIYKHEDDSDTWFEKVKKLAEEHGFAVRMKDYKETPHLYNGSIVDFTDIIRFALVGKTTAPNIWEISKVFGEERVIRRLKEAIDKMTSIQG